MKIKLITLILTWIFIIAGFTGCSSHDYDPEDYVSSYLSNTYGKYGTILNVFEMGIPIDSNGYVRFDLKQDLKGDFRFVDVIPGTPSKKFSNVPLLTTEEGLEFEIIDSDRTKKLTITGTIDINKMTVNIEY